MMKAKQSMRKPLWVGIVTAILLLTLSVILSVTCFAATEGITDVSISLSEDIIVKFYTSATTGDGSKLVVSFNDETTEITENLEGVFTFTGVTPQNLNDEMTAIMYAADGTTQLGEVKTVSVKSYLEAILALEYESSGCSSQLQYAAMRELAVNMLNYGAAAQSYIEHDIENLANKDLTPEQKALATGTITVGAADTDKAVSGDAWVGAGVRFDYKLGLYFVFKAESLEGITATVNGVEVTPEAYTVRGVAEPCWIIRYNAFNATNMNDVVTAKLTMADSTEQTFAYSIKSYVAAKGGAGNALSDLVNATYAYGFAAVAYVAEYVEVAPTFEQAGSITMDGKGYDFSGSKYGSVELPALNFTDYTAVTVNEGTESAPVVKTIFTLKSDVVAYAVELVADSCISLDGTLYSPHDLANASITNVAVTYDAAKGYFYDVADGAVAAPTAPIIPYGANLTITGTVTMTDIDAWVVYAASITLGTAAKAANVTLNGVGAAEGTSIRLVTDAVLLVSENSRLEVNPTVSYSIYLGRNTFKAANAARLIVDGTVVCTKMIRDTYFNPLDANAEYGSVPNVYVRKGTLETAGLLTYSLQVGSEAENAAGKLILTALGNNAAIQPPDNDRSGANLRWIFAKGTVKTTANVTNFAYVQLKESTLIDIRKGMTFDLSESTGYNMYHGYNSSTNRYLLIEQGATFITNSSTADANKMHYINKGTGYVYRWRALEHQILVNGEQQWVRVLIFSTRAVKQSLSADDCNDGPAFDANSSLTLTNETIDVNHLGAFYKTTTEYTDSNGVTQYVYCQIVTK